MKQFKRGEEVLVSNDNVNWEVTAYIDQDVKRDGTITYWCVEPSKYQEWAKLKRYNGLVQLPFKFCKNA
jgi:hypothetical protein